MKYFLEVKNFIIKFKFIMLLCLVVIVLVATGLFSYYFYKDNEEIRNEIKNQTKNEVEKEIVVEEGKEETSYIFVDVKGLVKKPGVYKVEEGNRINDVIKLAGGLLKYANTKYLNLSKKVTDEMVIIVYSNQEVKDMLNENKEVNTTLNPSNSENTQAEDTSDLVNINTALENKLMTLSGIGEVKAKAIIEYRSEFGNFTNIEDIMKVSGISESTYSKIKDFITI